MTSRTWIARAAALEAPEVGSVNLQVRTGMSVPFARHMVKSAEAPSAEPVNLQVRTGMSVPFSTYMVSEKSAEAQTAKAKK